MFSMQAFVDEMEKLAAHTTQKCRTGSTPIRVHKLADKERYDRRTTKTAAAEAAGKLLKGSKGLATGALSKPLVTGALAIGGWEALRRANQDRRLGRQMRLQQGMY